MDEVATALAAGGFEVERRAVYEDSSAVAGTPAHVDMPVEEAEQSAESVPAETREGDMTPPLTEDSSMSEDSTPSVPGSEEEESGLTEVGENTVAEKLSQLALEEAVVHAMEDGLEDGPHVDVVTEDIAGGTDFIAVVA